MGQLRGTFVRNVFLLSVAHLGCATAASAQHIWVDPRGEAKLTYSDNIDLTNSDRTGGFVLNTSAGFNSRVEGRKLKGAIDYALDYY